MVLVITPAEPGYLFQQMSDRIAALEQQVGAVMRQLTRGDQQAMVCSFTVGSAQCVVEFLESGTRVPMSYPLGYTPVAGHGGHVLDLTSGQTFIPVSAF